MTRPEALGVFGGTFDPVHLGHLRLAEEAREQLGLSRILWIPAGRPPHREAPRSDAARRLHMVRLAIEGNAGFDLDASEVMSGQPSYTVLTLERLRKAHPEQPLVLLLGADAFAGLPGWHRWRDIFDLAHLAIAHRPGFPWAAEHWAPALAAEFERRIRPLIEKPGPNALNEAAGNIVRFATTPLDISATRIRQLLAEGRSPRYLLPEAVLEYLGGIAT